MLQPKIIPCWCGSFSRRWKLCPTSQKFCFALSKRKTQVIKQAWKSRTTTDGKVNISFNVMEVQNHWFSHTMSLFFFCLGLDIYSKKGAANGYPICGWRHPGATTFCFESNQPWWSRRFNFGRNQGNKQKNKKQKNKVWLTYERVFVFVLLCDRSSSPKKWFVPERTPIGIDSQEQR